MSDALRELNSNSMTFSKVTSSGIGRSLLEGDRSPPVGHFIQAFL